MGHARFRVRINQIRSNQSIPIPRLERDMGYGSGAACTGQQSPNQTHSASKAASRTRD